MCSSQGLLEAADFVCRQCNSGADVIELKGVDHINQHSITSQEDGEDLWNQPFGTRLSVFGFPPLALS